MRDDLKKTVLVLIILVLPAVIQAQSWYDPGWNYRMPVTIDNSGNSDPLTDYQVKIALNSTNFNFSLAQSNGEDIRFTSSDGITLISHWIESWDAIGESAVVWVKVPSVSALSTIDVYMYYGNASVVDASDGSVTFEFFDDFESDYSEGSGWTPIADMTFVKADPSAAVYDNKLYVFGGYDRDTNCVKYFLNETLEYDPSTDTWTRLADMPTARWGQIAVEYNGLIHLFSGAALTGETGAHEIYDPATDTWSTGASVPPNLTGQGLMGIKYGTKIHLFYLEFHYEYDPATDTYTRLANVPTPRTWGTCALVNDSIYVIGGFSYGTPSGPSNVNEVYDPATDTWTIKAALPVQKYGVTRENPVINGKIYVTHGRNGAFYVNNFVYDPATDTWEQKSDGINPRDGVACGVIENKLYVVGGRDLFSCPVGLTYSEVYDPASDSGSAGNPWVVSNASIIDRDPIAQYEGSNGFLFDKALSTGDASAYSLHNHVTCAVDIYWNMTDFYGIADVQPQGVFGLTNNVTDGHLYYYNNGGISEFRWYTGSFTSLQTGSWNTWFPVTIVWNGANSKVIIDGTEHAVTANAINSDRIYFRINKATRYFVDLVRVRNYSPVEPALIYGDQEQLMLMVPILISPADNSTITDDTPQFVWSSSAGTGGTYTLQYSMNSDFSAPVTTVTGLTDTTFTPTTPLSPEGGWYWHVEATNSNGSSGYQASPFSFILDTQYPPVVTDIPNQTIDEGLTFATISLDDYVSDIDNLDSEISWTYSDNTELTVSIDVNRVATIGIPSTDWFGSE
nr:DUF2341 domain-containing protein [candidate division Zixibacteria bacterium]NIR65137.1 DUF2341 domain-containing protein [candidate division Zixibacteria bacterium]NIS16576.1 DUF2341 domain-containing protein [candidate division Zixibacteria bacterium]NIS48153.1 DUF2341 domain-containing protein [candidate division Zixibacteria bacterium]NIU16269.1 DUF2341 domain-containing protein [candidate division Zixibacteria bacterium]